MGNRNKTLNKWLNSSYPPCFSKYNRNSKKCRKCIIRNECGKEK